jgi:hypothetical protein
MSERVERATAADVGKNIRLTYNGREVAVVSVSFGTIEQGSQPRITVSGWLPKDWDQGPPKEEPKDTQRTS